MPGLDTWIAAQTRCATAAMLRAISATHLVMERPGFGQRVTPRPGSVLASPVAAHYDPDPDYFFHWFRDAAIVIEALRMAFAAGYAGVAALERLREFAQFSLTLLSLDGRAVLRQVNVRASAQAGLLQYLRPDEELAGLSGDAVLADVRVNADGTPDVTRWSRPQSDGPALTAVTLMRWWQLPAGADAPLRSGLNELIRAALDFTVAYAGKPSFDIWEETSGHHYYTQLVQAEALREGARWLEETGQPAPARTCKAAAQELISQLDALWSDAAGCYRASAARADGRELDMAVILAVLHAGRPRGRHSVLDPRTQATLGALEELFAAEYAINRERPPERAAAMGRYANDRYYSGGAYFFATLAAAEFYFRLAMALRSGEKLTAARENRRFLQRLGAGQAVDNSEVATLAVQRGDAFMRTVRAFTPVSGDLAEQFDRTTGVQTSAKNLSWSYAAFITAAVSRAQACRSTAASAPVTPPTGMA
jgi:glucoamylase